MGYIKLMNATAKQEKLIEIAIDEVVVNPDQPRREFKDEDIESLAASIQAVGLIHPPAVRSLGENRGYELIAGERRLRACSWHRRITFRVVSMITGSRPSPT